jgi:hypothetical protein
MSARPLGRAFSFSAGRYPRRYRAWAYAFGSEEAVISIDRRVHPRAEVKKTAVVLARHNAGVTVTIESVSIGGARFVGPLTLREGERIQILFEVDGHPVDVGAEVIWGKPQDINHDRVAVRFVEIPDDAKELIHKLVLATFTEEPGA